MNSKTKTEMISEPYYENGIWKGGKFHLPKGYYKLGERIINVFKENPDFVGQIYGPTGEERSFKRIRDRSIRCALWLKKQGIRDGDVICIVSKNQLDGCIPLLASLYLGVISSPLSYKDLNVELVRYFIETRKPKVLFVDEDNAANMAVAAMKLDDSIKVVVLEKKTGQLCLQDILDDQTDEEVENFECKKVKPDDPAFILNTSGTTNLPKGVVHSYGSFGNMLDYYKNDGSPSVIMEMLFFDAISGIRMIIRSIIFKATLIMRDNRNTDSLLGPLVEKYKVTQLWIMAITATAVSLKNRSKELEYDFSSVEMISFGGAPMSQETIEFICHQFKDAEILTLYGATESGTMLTGHLNPEKLSSSGKVLANVELKIVDLATKETLGPNEKGEIYCRTPRLMTRYWNNVEATEKAVDSEGWYHTEDLGYYDTDGYFYVLGRINDSIMICVTNSARKIRPSTIANVVMEVPGVAEAAVVPREHHELHEVPMAFITIAPGLQINENDIHEAVNKKLPDYMMLRGGVKFLETMPYTSTGKINIRKLRDMAKLPGDYRLQTV